MRRFSSVVAGVILILGGTFAAVCGAVLLMVIGPDGSLTSAPSRAVAAGSALVVDTARFDGGLPNAVAFSEATAGVSGLGDEPVFIGAGRAQDVLAYLSGTSYDVLEGADGRSVVLDQSTVAGEGTPSRPTAQSFWTVQASGTGNQSITLPLGTGDQLVVVMNVDASAPVDVRWSLGLEAPWVAPVAIAALSAGVAVMIIGGWLLAAGVRQSSARDRQATPADGRAASTEGSTSDADGPNQWGAAIAPSDQPSVPTPRSATGRNGAETDAGAIDLRLIGVTRMPVSSGAGSRVGPDAPPREPGR